MALTRSTPTNPGTHKEDDQFERFRELEARAHADESAERLDIGKNLKAYRKSRKLTQSQICEIMGVAKTSLIDYEKGRRDPPLRGLIKLVKRETYFYESAGYQSTASLDEIIFGRKPVSSMDAIQDFIDLFQATCAHLYEEYKKEFSNPTLWKIFQNFIDAKELVLLFMDANDSPEHKLKQIRQIVLDRYYCFCRAGPNYDPDWDLFSPEEYEENPETCEKEQAEYASRTNANWVYEIRKKGLDPDEILRLLEEV